MVSYADYLLNNKCRTWKKIKIYIFFHSKWISNLIWWYFAETFIFIILFKKIEFVIHQLRKPSMSDISITCSTLDRKSSRNQFQRMNRPSSEVIPTKDEPKLLVWFEFNLFQWHFKTCQLSEHPDLT